MAVSLIDIALEDDQDSSTLTVKLCGDSPAEATSSMIRSFPQFAESVTINGVNYPPGSPLITTTGGTVYSTNPLVIDGAQTSARGPVWINGTYSQGTKTASVTVSASSVPARSQLNYGFYLMNSTGATISGGQLVGGMISVKKNPPRVPIKPPVPPSASSCGITVS